MSRYASLTERFWAQLSLEPNGGCWPWVGAVSAAGYGQLRGEGRVIYAHRLAYELFIGPIPTGLYVCHSCDNPPCCNPAHLFAGTALDNNRDAASKGRLAIGERMTGAKLTTAQVLTIREAYAAGGVFQRQLAARFGVSRELISRIVLRARWAHV